MNLAGSLGTLNQAEIDSINVAALRIMERTGLRVEHGGLRERLAEAGAQVQGDIVRLEPQAVEEFIAASEPVPWPPQPAVTAPAGIFVGRYLNPKTGRHERWTEPALRDYIKLAYHLPNIDGASILGCPLALPHALHPLYQRLLCYKWGAAPGGSIWDARLLPYIEEMTAIVAQARGVPFADEWQARVYLLTPLKLGAVEAEHLYWCAERGYSYTIGHIMTAGATAPATVAGAVAVFLAENLFIAFIRRVLYGERRLHLHCSITVADMRTGVHPYGAPERPLANIIMAEMARHYRASFSGHGGNSDAKVPSYEAGAQKVLTALPILFAGGTMSISAGLLSTDEVFSPIQMVLDNELVGALRRFARGVEINDETLAVDIIEQVGPGGHFLDQEHTARHFRREHWIPALFARELLEGWLAGDCRTDVDRARPIWQEMMSRPDQPTGEPERVEQLQQVIDRAARALGVTDLGGQRL